MRTNEGFIWKKNMPRLSPQWNQYFPAKINKVWRHSTSIPLTLCFCSSVRTSLRTLAQGMSSGHHTGLQLSFPHPGFPRPVEYFSISGMNARSWAWGKGGKRDDTDTKKTPKWKAAVSLTPLSRRQEARIDRVPAAGVLRWSRAANRNRLSKRRTMRSCLLTDQSMAVAPAWRVRQTPRERQGAIQHSQPVLAKAPVHSAEEQAGQYCLKEINVKQKQWIYFDHFMDLYRDLCYYLIIVHCLYQWVLVHFIQVYHSQTMKWGSQASLVRVVRPKKSCCNCGLIALSWS